MLSTHLIRSESTSNVFFTYTVHEGYMVTGEDKEQIKKMVQNKCLGWTACIPALYAKGVCSYLETKTRQLHSSWFSKSLLANSWPFQDRFLLYSLQFVIVLYRITCHFTKRVIYKFVKQYSLFIYKYMANLSTSSTYENAPFLQVCLDSVLGNFPICIVGSGT